MHLPSETNSFFNHGAPNASDVAGAALWALDYTLFAGVSGIKRMHFHEGIGYKYNMVSIPDAIIFSDELFVTNADMLIFL